MFTNKDIVCISPIDWDFLWQRHQIFMSMLIKKGSRVVYVENINPSPALDFSFFPKAFRRILRIFFRIHRKEWRDIPNLTVITPFVIPFKNPIAYFINKTVFIKFLSLHIKSLKVKKPIIWTYLATSLTLQLIESIDPQAVIYDCVFDAILHPNSPADIETSERKLIESADLIFTDNHYLFKRCKSINATTYILPPGVDFEHFAYPEKLTDSKLLSGIKPPRICYFGGIDKIRQELGLIEYVAKKRPDWSIVFFGTIIKTDVSRIKLKNVFLNRPIEHSKLPNYLKEMDVLILPYKIIPFSKSIFPAKIFECLATGKPIVSTPLEELTYFENDIIRRASTKEDFLLAIEDSLTKDTEEKKKKRLKVAQENSWFERFKEMQTLIDKSPMPKLMNRKP